MKRFQLTVYTKGLEVNSSIKNVTDVEYDELVIEVQRAQAGQTDSLIVINNNVTYYIPKKQLKRSVIIIRNHTIPNGN